ncbi:GntR family transcriptional regulator [Demetria terragena]|uniref:GntR family transcriptional regulator n=1 Tax=Demetria terragena TaxID=63959 RepID=UPI0003803CAF|nr:GntR family transcriptional regulator [Demetria terragena]
MNVSVDDIYQHLRGEILAGALFADAPLREAAIAEQHGVSRTPVRDALRRLSGDGLVTLTPHRGARVSELATTDTAAVFELRALLEGFAARHAAERGSPDLDRLSDLCDAMETCAVGGGDPDEITRLNLEFHRLVHAASDNPLLPGVLQDVIAISLVRRTFSAYDDVETARSFSQHRDLVRALRARDGAWAEAVMVAHIRGARRAYEEGTSTPKETS